MTAYYIYSTYTYNITHYLVLYKGFDVKEREKERQGEKWEKRDSASEREREKKGKYCERQKATE